MADKKTALPTGLDGDFHTEVRQGLDDLARINPLVESVSDTTLVQSVLGFLAFSFQNSGGAISDSDSIGVGAILDTCRAALAVMNGVNRE